MNHDVLYFDNDLIIRIEQSKHHIHRTLLMKREMCILVDDNQSLLTNNQQLSFDSEMLDVDWSDRWKWIVHHNNDIVDLDELDQDVSCWEKNRKWKNGMKWRDITW